MPKRRHIKESHVQSEGLWWFNRFIYLNLKILGEDLFIDFQAVNENGYSSCNNSDKDDEKMDILVVIIQIRMMARLVKFFY